MKENEDLWGEEAITTVILMELSVRCKSELIAPNSTFESFFGKKSF